jgi:DNA-binding transcriptional ArsR family regulator
MAQGHGVPRRALNDEERQRLRLLVGATRAAVFEALVEPQTTAEVSASLGLADSSVSRHLTALARTGLVDRKRQGRHVYYVLNANGRRLLALFESLGTR